MVIRIENLQKNYKTYARESGLRHAVKSLFSRKPVIIQALKSISFNVEAGELIGLLGPNGAGKSTAMKLLSGVLFPTAGRAEVLGFVPWKQRRKYVAHIGAVFGQKSQLIWDIPPLDAFQMNRAIYGIPEKDFGHNLDTMAELLSAGDIMKKPTRQLSLGERMKCEFIMAMLHNPRVVFLDEPTIGLDVLARDNIRKFILEKNREGTTFILTTHDIGDVEHLAKRVIVINHGEIVFDNTLANLRRYLGRKKVIKLSTRTAFRELSLDGIRISGRLSPYETEMELDLSLLELDNFIRIISETNTVADRRDYKRALQVGCPGQPHYISERTKLNI